MALGESSVATGGALVPPQYMTGKRPAKHTHAKVGGGRLTHAHAAADPGHRHDGTLPLPERLDGKAPREFSDEQRAELAKRGAAMPDGSYPITDLDSLRRAIQAFGRAPDKTAVQRHIIKRARALGLTSMLPDGWDGADGKSAGLVIEEPIEHAVDFRLDMHVKSVTETRAGDLILDGYANTWAVDRDDEAFARQAFELAAEQYMVNPILCVDHDRRRPIGTAMARPVLDDTGVRTKFLVPKPPEGSEPWHVKAFHDIKRKVLRALSVGGKFYRDGKTIIGMDWHETSVVGVPSNPFSIFDVAEAKGLGFGKAATQQPGVGRGHGAHHHGPLGPRRGRAARPRTGRRGARHVHRNGVSHRHPGGRTAHRHAKHAHGEFEHVHGAARPGHWHPGQKAALDIADLWEIKAAPPEDGDADTPEQEAQEIEGRGPVGMLLQGLLEALEEVIDDDDMSEADKVSNVEDILDDFVDEAQARLGDAEVPDDDDAGKWAQSLAGTCGQGTAATSIAAIQARLTPTTEPPETKMPSKTTDAPDAQAGTTADDDAALPEGLDAKTVRGLVAKVEELQREKREQKLAEEAEAKAAELLEQERKEEADRKAAEDAEAKRLQEMVNAAIERQRSASTTGRTYLHGAATGSPQHGSTGGKEARFGTWLKDLKDARKGDWNAYQRIEEGHKSAMEHFKLDAKALNEGTSSAGGFLVPPQYLQDEFAEYRIPASPMRSLLRSRPVTTNLVYVPRATGISAVAWVAENATKPSTDQTFGQIAVGVYALAGISKVSNQMLDDSNPTVDSIVREDLGREIGQAGDIAILNGDGNGKPTGILNTSGITLLAIGTMKLWQAISAAMTTVAATFFGPARAVVAPPNMVGKLRDAVDANGRPILQAGFVGNLTIQQNPYPNDPQAITPVGMIYGLPLYEDANMPANLGGGSNETRVLVGDFSQSLLLDRQGVTMDVSTEAGTSFEANQTWFRGEVREGFTAARQPTAICAITGLTPATT